MSKLYWRCVWANKATLAAYCLLGLVVAMEIIRQLFLPDIILAVTEILIGFVGGLLAALTSLGTDTPWQYHRTMRVLQAKRRPTVSRHASYCYLVGHELALQDYAKKQK